MAWISKQKRSGKLLVEWRDLAGKKCSRTAPNATTARALKLDIEECLSRGRNWQPESTGDEVDINTLTAAYIEHRALRLRPRTLVRYTENLCLFIRFLRTLQPKGKLSASMLTVQLLDDFYLWLCRAETGRHGHARSADTSRKIVETVQVCWEWAEGSERWPQQIPRPRRIEMKRAEPAPVIAPTFAEMDRAVLACNGWHRKLATFLRYSGLRVGESMLLLWSDVDMDAGMLTLRPEIVKTGRGRVIPLSPHLLEEMATWGVREGWLIPSGRKKGKRERQARPRDLNRAWQRAEVREDRWKGRPDHAFRKGWKSGMLMLGAHPDSIDYLQGHRLGQGSRGSYIDPLMLRLPETVALVPKIADTNVVAMPRKLAAVR